MLPMLTGSFLAVACLLITSIVLLKLGRAFFHMQWQDGVRDRGDAWHQDPHCSGKLRPGSGAKVCHFVINQRLLFALMAVGHGQVLSSDCLHRGHLNLLDAAVSLRTRVLPPVCTLLFVLQHAT